ncbi:MAG TPA: ATP-binding protein [Polyangia bacterium]|nr:ATP-binding protein [Polyangia bacterium]
MSAALESFHDSQLAVLEQVASGAPLGEVLAATVRLVESQADDMRCSILLYDEARGELRLGAGPSLPRWFAAAVDGLKIGPEVGACGAAAFRRERVVCEDIAMDARWASCRDAVIAHGLRACWSQPVFSTERALLGTFAMYYAEARGPTAGEIAWVQAASHIAAIAIERARADLKLRQNEEQLRQAQKMEAVGRLAGGVAHDFNNILSVVLGTSAAILDELEPRAPLRPEIEAIRKAGERAGALTRQLLALSRQQILAPRVVDLADVVAGLEPLLRRLVGEDIALTVERPEGPAPVLADPGQLEQVVVNLVVNARDAMPSGGSLEIETAVAASGAPGGRTVSLTVADSGHGMDETTRARIFEPFFTTKESGKGTGLGLSTVYGIVSQSGGRVSVESAPGAGATFSLHFPRAEGEVASEPEPPAPERPATVGGSDTVLLVEDEDQVRATVRSILRRGGYTVLEAQNGGEAFLVCEQYGKDIDLLLTDVVMPRMNGTDLAKRLGALRPAMRVLYMSGHTRDAVIHDGVASRGISFLQKPVTPDTLLRKVRDVLDRA